MYVRLIIWAQVFWVFVLASFCYAGMTGGRIGELTRALEEIARRAEKLEKLAADARSRSNRECARARWCASSSIIRSDRRAAPGQ